MTAEFHYRLPLRMGGHRPGAHPGSSLGAGQEFIAHARLYDRPDPRRLDVRASLRDLRGDWLVRVNRERGSVPVYVVADVSASMRFGAPRTKLEIAAEFVRVLGHSAFRVGDALGMLAFDVAPRNDLLVPARVRRGGGELMAELLRRSGSSTGGTAGFTETIAPLANARNLVFLVSDFHWPLDGLGTALDTLAHSFVVPMVVWDPAELEPPARDALAAVRDSESGVRRTLWIRPKLRAAWRDAVAHRRAELERFFAARALRPFYVCGTFDGEAMSQYFLEAAA